jgi:hypothetical protein
MGATTSNCRGWDTKAFSFNYTGHLFFVAVHLGFANWQRQSLQVWASVPQVVFNVDLLTWPLAAHAHQSKSEALCTVYLRLEYGSLAVAMQ